MGRSGVKRDREQKGEDAARDLKAKVVAWLYSQKDADKKYPRLQEVVERMRLKQPDVSKLKTVAEKKGWLIRTHTLSPEEQEEVARFLFPYHRLREKLDRLAAEGGVGELRGVRIYDSGPAETDAEKYDLRLKRFGRAAATVFAELLPKMGVTGVTWGQTIAGLIKGLASLPSLPRRERPVKFVPLCGVLLNDPNIQLSATGLVTELSNIVNGSAKGAISLGAVPARMPARFALDGRRVPKTVKEALAELINDIPGYRMVFGTAAAKAGQAGGLANQLDTIITSVGCDYQESGDPWLEEMINRERVSKQELDKIAVGDIGGVFLPHPNGEKEAYRSVQQLNGRATGIKRAHIEACVGKGRGDALGVILVAVGRRKAGVVAECVRQGLVNELIIDHDLAHGLLE